MIRLRTSERRSLKRRLNRTIPFPTNEPRIERLVPRVDDIRGARVHARAAEAEPFISTPARTVQATPHHELDHHQPLPHNFYPLRVGVLPAAAVHVRTGIVITGERQLVVETARNGRQLHHSRLLDTRRVPRPRLLPGVYGTLLVQWADNYYHWLVEGLPRLLVLEALGFQDLSLLVPSPLTEFHRESLGLLGVSDDRLVPARWQMVGGETLLWPAPPAPSGDIPNWICRELSGRLRRGASADTAEPFRRLLISRRHARHRRLVNEDDLVAALEPYHFEVVEPEALSFSEQIRIFAEASIIVAPHGAGLANMLFARKATVIEIFHPEWVNPGPRRLARSAGLSYWYVVGGRVRSRGRASAYQNIHVSIPDVVATVEQALAGS